MPMVLFVPLLVLRLVMLMLIMRKFMLLLLLLLRMPRLVLLLLLLVLLSLVPLWLVLLLLVLLLLLLLLWLVLLMLLLLLLLLNKDIFVVFPDGLSAVRGIPYASFLFVRVCGVVGTGATKRCKFRRSIVYTRVFMNRFRGNPRFIPPSINVGLKSSGDNSGSSPKFSILSSQATLRVHSRKIYVVGCQGTPRVRPRVSQVAIVDSETIILSFSCA